MNSVGFFTAVRYSDNLKLTFGESMLQTVDNYFYLGGKKAHVITDAEGHRTAILSGTRSSLLARIIKVASYLTVVLPVVLLAAKAALRYSLRETYRFTLINPAQQLVAEINQTPIPAVNYDALIDDVETAITSRPNGDEVYGEAREWRGRFEGNNIPWRATKVGDRIEIMPRSDEEDEDNDLDNLTIIFHIGEGNRAARNNKTVALYSDLITIKEVAIANELDKIVVPSSKLILPVGEETKTYIIQVNGHLDATDDKILIEQEYRDYSRDRLEDMNKVIRQITTLMARINFTHEKNSDYPFDNFRVIPVSSGPHLRNVDALAAEVANIESGGNTRANQVPFTQGLLKLASTKDQVDIIDEELEKQGVWLSIKELKQRLDEIHADAKLESFYAEKSILGNGQNEDRWEILIKPITTLPLKLNEKCKIQRHGQETDWDMKAAVIFLLKFINLNLTKSKPLRNHPIKTRRRIELNLANVNEALCTDSNGKLQDRWKEDLELFETVGAADGLKPAGADGGVRHVTEAERNKLWLLKILQALKNHKVIFDFTVDPQCIHYVIQA